MRIGKMKLGMFLIVVLLTIGFAAVTLTLYLNGSVVIGFNQDFDINFTKAVVDGTLTNSAISADGKSISYTTKKLVELGDKSVLEYEVTNNSTKYNAKIEVNCTLSDPNMYNVVVTPENALIKAGAVGTGKAVVSLINLNVSGSQIVSNFECKLNVTAVNEEFPDGIEPGGGGGSTGGEIDNIINGKSASSTLIALAEHTDDLLYDGTKDNNLRYVGADPNNYVYFNCQDDTNVNNCELWQIVGVMNNIRDETGKMESRVKIVRGNTIGRFNFDYKKAGFGSAESYDNPSSYWNDSQLMMMLNPQNRILENYTVNTEKYVLDTKGNKIFNTPGSYYNRITGFKPPQNYSGVDRDDYTNSAYAVDFSSIGLSEYTRNMILGVVWNTGYISTSFSTIEAYTSERDAKTPSPDRLSTWLGEVALLYASDYGFASKGSETKSREECLQLELKSYDSNCANTNWINKRLGSQHLLSPENSRRYTLYLSGRSIYDTINQTDIAYGVYPTIYLKSDVRIMSGHGTSTDPYILAQ